MIQSSNLAQKTHYEIIGVEEDASHEEIRKSYRSAVLNFHPDKLKKASENSNLELECGNQFLDVQNAWTVLGNPMSRAIYDDELQTLRLTDVNAEDVKLGDVTIEGAGNDFELRHRCRCGDFFSVDSSELAEMGYLFLRSESKIRLQTPTLLPAFIILPCGSCSLRIRLLVDASVTLETLKNN